MHKGCNFSQFSLKHIFFHFFKDIIMSMKLYFFLVLNLLSQTTSSVEYLSKYLLLICVHYLGLPQWLSGKESACNAGDMDLIPGSGRSFRGGNSNPLQYSWLENPMDKGAWPATVCGVIKSQTQLTNSDTHTHTHTRSFYFQPFIVDV